ncbi:MAG: IS3 family transposase, partial [Candidatus Promineifilaceae bacterium]
RRMLAHQLAGPYPVRTLCRLLGVAPSSDYYQPAARSAAALQAALKELAGQWPTYGYRRLTAELQRASGRVNHKRVARLMAELGLQAPPKRRGRRTTTSQHGGPRFPNLARGLALARPDQVWLADITSVRLRAAFVYLAVLMDVFSRGCRGWGVGRELDRSLTEGARARALRGGRKSTIRTRASSTPPRDAWSGCKRRTRPSAWPLAALPGRTVMPSG